MRIKNGLRFLGSRDRSAIEETETAKTGMSWVSNDDVVENFDFEKLTGSNEVTGNFDVRFRWGGISTRVRMRDYDCGSTCHYCQSKNFPRMTKDCIHRANGHQVVTFNASAGVEDEYHQTFTFRIEVRMSGDMRFPIGGCLIRRFTLLHRVGSGTFP
jgi:hypothetical protein